LFPPRPSGRHRGRATRLLNLRALMLLARERLLANRVMPALRRSLRDSRCRARLQRVSRRWFSDRRSVRGTPRTGCFAPRPARDLVISGPGMPGCTQVFRGTCVPGHAIAADLDPGGGEADRLAAFPRLTREMMRPGPFHAADYPVWASARAAVALTVTHPDRAPCATDCWDSVKFLIDACWTVHLVSMAHAENHEAQRVARVAKAGWKDCNAADQAAVRDLILVTNNASDFGRVYGK